MAHAPSIPSLRPGIEIVGERLDLSEWVHIAAQGRDHYVRIVYEGHLYPFGHRAALIKITERKFRDTPLPNGGSTPVAQLIQREYIVVREPEKELSGQSDRQCRDRRGTQAAADQGPSDDASDPRSDPAAGAAATAFAIFALVSRMRSTTRNFRVLADFAQFLPDRSLLVTADPYHPRRLRVTISGPVPLGPRPTYPDTPPPPKPPPKPTEIVVIVQERDPAIRGDLGWRDASVGVASINVDTDGQFASETYLTLWSGSVQFAPVPAQGQFRLLIREFEYVTADWAIVHPGGEALEGLSARLCQPSTLCIVIWPEASKAQNNIAAVSAEGNTVWL